MKPTFDTINNTISDFSLERLRKNWMLISVYAYIFLPTLIFIVMWLRPVVAILLGVALIFASREAYVFDNPIYRPQMSKELAIKLALAVSIILIWVLFSGIGASVAQYPDHMYRNTIFRTLVDSNWPLMNISENGEIRGLSYYIGFWLPAALLSKITGSYSAGFLFMQIWSLIGLSAVWYFICEKQQKVRVWYIVLAIFFGGLDSVGRFLTMNYYQQVGNRYEWWAVIYNYPGFSTQLFWAYNQFIYAVLIFCLIQRQRSNKSILLIWSASLITATIPAIGMIPFAIYRALCNSEEGSGLAHLKNTVVSGITFQNSVGLVISLVMTLFLMPNDAVTRNASNLLKGVIGASTASSDGVFKAYSWTTNMWMWLLFCLLEFGVYYVLIYKSENNKDLYWISLIVLLVIPWIRIGDKQDFCMRACIPALFVLMQLVISATENYTSQKQYIALILLIASLFVGGIASLDTFRGTMHDTASKMAQKKEIPVEELPTPAILFTYNNFSTSGNTFFYRYLAKQVKEGN